MSRTDETLADSLSQDEAYCSHCNHSFSIDTVLCPRDGTRLVRLAAERDELLGKVLDGRYEIKAPLGRGGMGTVYVGIQLSVDREVAIKVIHPKLASDRNAVKRFLREARLASRLNQPSIVNVYDFGQSEGVLFLVTELLRGHTLASELGQGRRLNLRRTAVIGIQLCDALEAAHAQDIVHRDLKPGNIVILDDPPGRDLVKVLDFGLAKSLALDEGSQATTNTGAVLGTPLYMSPEQIEGRPSDQRADLYSLGCILYEMASGAPPYVDPAVSAVLARHIGDTPAPLPSHVSPRFRALVERLLAKAPADRVQSAGDVRLALQGTLDTTPAIGVPVYAPDAPDTMPDLVAALAETAAVDAQHARSSPGAVGAAPSVIVSPSAGGQWATAVPPVRSRRPLLVIAAVFAAAVLAAVIVLAASPGGQTHAVVPPRDASAHAATAPALAVPVDASAPDAAAVPIDAAVTPIDAATAVAPDARPAVRPQPPQIHRPPPPPPPAVDAGVDLEFYHRPAKN